MRTISIIGGILAILIVGGLMVLFGSAPAPMVAAPSEGVPYKEITNPSGFVNTGGAPVTIGQYVGEKVILLDVMTYSCINCQRTFPYVTAWYEKYKDDGFIVIGIHTPEFAFEKNIKNVEEAMKRFGITFPVVLDNDYGTWNAYGNRYWPRKYLIDIHGRVVYDHIGEGAYEETEMKIRELLDERASLLGAPRLSDGALASASLSETRTAARSPETYFGALRNEYLANGKAGQTGLQTFSLPAAPAPNALYFGGTWRIEGEYAEAQRDASLRYFYSAQEVYLVADADTPVEVEVLQDGKVVGAASGEDVKNGVVRIGESRLYKLIRNPAPGEHLLELNVRGKGVRFYAFTFG